MQIKIERTKDNLELVKAMASREQTVSIEAQQAMASFIGPVISQIINAAPQMSNQFRKMPYNVDDSPSFPIDLFYDITGTDYIKVYSTSTPGGFASNTVVPTQSELKIATYHLDSAYNFDRKYAAKSRLDVVAKTFERMTQEVLLKQDKTSASLILGTLADNVSTQLTSSAGTSLSIADFNKLIVLAKRVNVAWNKGTPAGRVGGVTDLWLSPERMADLRALAYEPINFKGANQVAGTNTSGFIAAPDALREKLFTGAGVPEFYGFTLHEINELGKAQRYCRLFNAAYGTFSATADDLVLGLDLSNKDALIRAVGTDETSNSEVVMQVDDQWTTRQRKIGYFMDLEEGRVVLDKRVIFGIRIASAAT